MKNDCLFCAIIDGEIPSKKVYEDEQCYAFYDIEPVFNPFDGDSVPISAAELNTALDGRLL